MKNREAIGSLHGFFVIGSRLRFASATPEMGGRDLVRTLYKNNRESHCALRGWLSDCIVALLAGCWQLWLLLLGELLVDLYDLLRCLIF